MHRNTLLLTACLAVIAILIVLANITRSLNPPAPQAVQQVLPTPTITMLPYQNETCGVSLLYPSNLFVRDSIATTTAFLNAETPSQSVVLACEKNIPRAAVPPSSIKTVTIKSASSSATISAQLYHTTDAQNGSPLDELIFTNKKRGLDVYIGGFGETFQKIINTLQLL